MPAKQKIPAVAGRIEPQVNRYYAKVSRRYRNAGIIAMVLLLLYLGLLFVFASEYITTENLAYLARDLGSSSEDAGGDYGVIVYNGTKDTRFAAFRGGVAVCAPDSYRYYDKNGSVIVNDPLNYADPVTAASDKYMLVYDLGGTGWSVYNQLALIVSRHSDEPIIAGDIASDGSLVLVTRSRETRYVATLYNAAFNRIMASYKENYVLTASVSPDGEQFLTASAVPASTDFNCEIEICRRGEDSPLAKDVLPHAMPLLSAARDGGFLVLSDSAVYYYDDNGVLEKTVPLPGMTLKYADIRDGCVAMAGAANALGSEYRVLILGEDGETLFDRGMHERIAGIRAGAKGADGLAYFRTADSAVRITPDGEEERIPLEAGETLELLPLQSGALLCQSTSARQIFTDD